MSNIREEYLDFYGNESLTENEIRKIIREEIARAKTSYESKESDMKLNELRNPNPEEDRCKDLSSEEILMNSVSDEIKKSIDCGDFMITLHKEDTHKIEELTKKNESLKKRLLKEIDSNDALLNDWCSLSNKLKEMYVSSEGDITDYDKGVNDTLHRILEFMTSQIEV